MTKYMLNEKDLIDKCLANDEKAISELYRKYAGILYPICLRYSGNEADARDLFHDGFLRILFHLKKFRYEGSFEGWMKRIMVTSSINFYKRKKSGKVDAYDELPVGSESDQVTPIDHLSAKEITLLINELPDGYRTIFNLYAIEGYKHREIADMLQISESTSKSQYMKARRFLISRMNEWKP